MEPQPDRITWTTIIGWLLLAGVITMVAVPIGLWVGAAGQPLVARIAVAIFCSGIVYRLALVIRHAVMLDHLSPAEAAMPRQAGVATDPLLAGLVRELRWHAMWRGVTPGLWAHLQQLCQQRGAVLPAELMPRSADRPTWPEAERIVRFLEEST